MAKTCLFGPHKTSRLLAVLLLVGTIGAFEPIASAHSSAAAKRTGAQRRKGLTLAQNDDDATSSTSSLLMSSDYMPPSTLEATIKPPSNSDQSGKEKALAVYFGLLGQSAEDKLVNSKWAGGTIELVGNAKLGSMFNAELSILQLATAGQYTSQYDLGGKAPNGTMIEKAIIDFKPIEPISIQAGVLNVDFSDYPTHMEPNGFPGVRQGLTAQNDYVKGEVFAIQSIPISDTATVKPAEAGVTSTFMAYGGNVGFNPKSIGWFKIGGSYTRFQFNNLNSSAATDSEYLGNTVVSIGSRPRFKYEFGGYEAAASMSARILPWLRPEISGAFIRNERAPQDTNIGYIYGTAVSFKFGDNEIKPSFNFYYDQSDTLPATYARIGRSYNNRFGTQMAISYNNKPSQTKATVRYTTANEIDDMPYTADRHTIFFSLEKGYDLL